MTRERSPQQKSRDAISSAEDEGLLSVTVELARAHLESYPEDIGARVELGRALTWLSRFDEAHSALDQAFDEASESWNEAFHQYIFCARGRLEEHRGDFSRAEHWFAKALEVAPHRTYNYIFLGVLVSRRGEIKRAEAIYRDAIATVTPTEGDEFEEIYANLGATLVSQERYEEAIELFERALELDPEFEFAQIRLKDVRKLFKFRQSK